MAANTAGSPDVVTVFCSEEIVAVGLKATRNTMSAPLLMPPCTPPEWLVVVVGPSGPATNGSLCSLPVIIDEANPLPISKPFVAGSDSMPLARVGLEPVEDRFAQPGRHPPRHRSDHSAQGIAVAPGLLDGVGHGGGGLGVGAPGGIGFDLVERHRRRIDRGLNGVDPAHPGQHLDAGHVGEESTGHGGRSHPANGLPGRRTPTAAVIVETVLGLVGVVGVAGTVDVAQMIVGPGALVVVLDHHGQRRTGGAALEKTGQDPHLIRLLPLGHQPALTGPASVEIALNVGDVERQARRTAVDHDTDRRTVGFAERGQAEELSEAAAHDPECRRATGQGPVASVWPGGQTSVARNPVRGRRRRLPPVPLRT